jgi:hypothetical protein
MNAFKKVIAHRPVKKAFIFAKKVVKQCLISQWMTD